MLWVCALLSTFDSTIGIEVPKAASYRVQGTGLVVQDGSGHALDGVGAALDVRVCDEGLCAPLAGLQLPVRVSAVQGFGVNGKQLRGGVWFYVRDGAIAAVNRLPLEDYLVATVGSEMPKAFPPEALKAQAVVARTYALSRRMRRENEVVQLASSTLDQVYNGLTHESPETRAAVDATHGQVLVFEHEPIDAFFFSSCGGRTRDARLVFGVDQPYLRGVPCGFCDDAATAHWVKKLSYAEMQGKLGYKVNGATLEGETADGRAKAVVFKPSGAKVPPEVLRSKLGYAVLKSPTFAVSCDGGGCTFTGRGAGHAVGMCQWGARGMALKGHLYTDIVAAYFPGVALKTLY